jgi:hypothetical protein
MPDAGRFNRDRLTERNVITMARRGGSSRTVSRSARTGRFVRTNTAARSPRTTTTERVGSGTGNARTVNRSASTGRFVTAATAARHPGTTITQHV